MHERQAIREAVIAQLKGTGPTWRTAAGDRVIASRMEPHRQHELPVLSVYTDGETVEETETAPRELRRVVTVAVDGWVQVAPGENVDDALDDLALEVETAMDLDVNLAGAAFGAVLRSTETAIKIDGDRPMGVVHLEFAVTYHTDLRLAAPADNFDTAGVQHDVGPGLAAADQAGDVVTGIYQE